MSCASIGTSSIPSCLYPAVHHSATVAAKMPLRQFVGRRHAYICFSIACTTFLVIVAQMVPAQASRAYSPFEDTENILISVSEPAQGERCVSYLTHTPIFVLCITKTECRRSAAVTCASLAPAGPNCSRILCSLCCSERAVELPAAFDVLVQHQLFRDLSNDVDLLEE